MKKVLVTGANKGIGFECARQLAKQGVFVFIGSRNLENGLKAANTLKTEGLENVRAIQLDVSNQESVNLARAEIEKSTNKLDILINNAGISGGLTGQNALEVTIDTFKDVFNTNLYGVIRVTRAFMDLLKNSDEPRIVNVSSGIGSHTLNSEPQYQPMTSQFVAYGTSKSALNMYTINLAYELRDTAFKVNMVDPGYTNTDLNARTGTGTVETAANRILNYATIDKDGPTGMFYSWEYNPETGMIPW